ncbi:MAG: hypothetical protein KTR32_18480 [Granulosicoccus sp.]|nr:hypothetical protein [Granulosicoccus sp.]
MGYYVSTISRSTIERIAPGTAPLGRWFGLGENDLQAALPNLCNFNGSALNYFG